MVPTPSMAGAPSGVAALTDLGVIRARGADAATFLQGQLTNDVRALDAPRAQPTGYCSAKGRLLATFVAWRSAPEEFLLVCSADLLPATLKRLSMFVLRARCKLDDASAEWRLEGLAGAPAGAALGAAAPAAAWDVTQGDGVQVVRLPDAAGAPRYLRASPTDTRDGGGSPAASGEGGVAGSSAGASAWAALSLDDWHWLEVQSGVPRIAAATVEQFVPQMVNFEIVGGVSFGKGCYPGQEVVARSQYRGTLKRRMALFEAEAGMRAAQEVFDEANAAQPAGLVVNAAPAPGGGSSALIEVKLAALASGRLRLGEAGGPLLAAGALPYALSAVDDEA